MKYEEFRIPLPVLEIDLRDAQELYRIGNEETRRWVVENLWDRIAFMVDLEATEPLERIMISGEAINYQTDGYLSYISTFKYIHEKQPISEDVWNKLEKYPPHQPIIIYQGEYSSCPKCIDILKTKEL